MCFSCRMLKHWLWLVGSSGGSCRPQASISPHYSTLLVQFAHNPNNPHYYTTAHKLHIMGYGQGHELQDKTKSKIWKIIQRGDFFIGESRDAESFERELGRRIPSGEIPGVGSVTSSLLEKNIYRLIPAGFRPPLISLRISVPLFSFDVTCIYIFAKQLYADSFWVFEEFVSVTGGELPRPI